MKGGNRNDYKKIVLYQQRNTGIYFYLNSSGHNSLLVQYGVGSCHVIILHHPPLSHSEPGFETARSTLLKIVNLNLGKTYCTQ